MQKIKIWFFGTPELSAKVLWDLLNDEKFSIEFVVTNPDKPFGRKQILTPSEVAQIIEWSEIPLFKPNKIRDENFYKTLEKYNCDYFVVVAYGKILPKEILEIPKKLCINVHGSILPKYRGASPIQSVLLNGEHETWVTIMQMSEKMDEWDIILIEKIVIDKKETSGSLFDKFGEISGKSLIKAINWLESWELTRIPQDENLATYCKKIEKQDWEIKFETETAKEIFQKWQAYNPWPGIFTFYEGKKLIIEDCEFEEIIFDKNDCKIGDIIKIGKEFAIICKNGILKLKQVKLEWKKSQKIEDFVNGNQKFLESNLSK